MVTCSVLAELFILHIEKVSVEDTHTTFHVVNTLHNLEPEEVLVVLAEAVTAHYQA